MRDRKVRENGKEIFGWAMYDWANSAFSTTVGTVFLGPYLASLAAEAATAFPDGMARVSLSVGLQVLFLPILGAIADYSHLRKTLMRLFATIGAIATVALFFIAGQLWWMGGLLYIIANLAFGAAMVFYNAYLPDIAPAVDQDRVSSYGWAMGYLGGGLLLLLNLALYQFRDALGVPTSLAVRINLSSAGLWWLGFSMITWTRLKSRNARKPLPAGKTYLSVGFSQLKSTLKELKSFPETIKFLLAYFLYNDGIQTVIAVSATFAAAPLVRGGLGMDTGTLTMVILMIQFMAFFGALLWGKLAGWVGAKQSVVISLVIWSGVVVYAYFGLYGESRTLQFFILGACIALVMGGSQAISRSLFARFIPRGREAEYYSFYEVSERGTSWIGPLLFGLMNQVFGSLRPALLSLIFFFIAGLALLPFVNVRKATVDLATFEAKRELND